MFLKEKHDGTVKACRCADGRPQQEYMSKEEVSSPTVSLEAMVLSCAIDAKENRYMVVTDIPGAFLHADMEDDVHMLLEGTIAELIIKLEPCLYRKNVWYDKKGKLMLDIRKLYMEHYKQPYYSGGYYPVHYRIGVSRSTRTTNA